MTGSLYQTLRQNAGARAKLDRIPGRGHVVPVDVARVAEAEHPARAGREAPAGGDALFIEGTPEAFASSMPYG